MNNQFKSCYAIASHNHGEDNCHYLIRSDGEYVFGSLADAMIFNSPKEVFDYLLDHPQLADYGACYIELAQVTLDRIKAAAEEARTSHKLIQDCEYGNLYLNYHKLSYAL